MNGKSNYMVQDILGFYVYEAETGTKAWSKHMTSDTKIDDVIAFDSKELQRWLNSRGYQTIARTPYKNVYSIR